MTMIEEWRRDCAHCRQPVTLKWKNGPILSKGVCLIFDQVFHDKCWDKFWADHNGKRMLPRGAEGRWWPGLGCPRLAAHLTSSAMRETSDLPPAAFNRLLADFSRMLTDLADQHRTAMCGMSERAAFQYLEKIIASAEVALAVWPDASEPNGVGLHVIKGLGRVMTAMEPGVPARVLVDAVPCVGREQAVAAGQRFDGKSD